MEEFIQVRNHLSATFAACSFRKVRIWRITSVFIPASGPISVKFAKRRLPDIQRSGIIEEFTPVKSRTGVTSAVLPSIKPRILRITRKSIPVKSRTGNFSIQKSKVLKAYIRFHVRKIFCVFRCDICEIGFSDRFALKRHRAIHEKYGQTARNPNTNNAANAQQANASSQQQQSQQQQQPQQAQQGQVVVVNATTPVTVSQGQGQVILDEVYKCQVAFPEPKWFS